MVFNIKSSIFSSNLNNIYNNDIPPYNMTNIRKYKFLFKNLQLEFSPKHTQKSVYCSQTVGAIYTICLLIPQ